jgi:hypothetical protein
MFTVVMSTGAAWLYQSGVLVGQPDLSGQFCAPTDLEIGGIGSADNVAEILIYTSALDIYNRQLVEGEHIMGYICVIDWNDMCQEFLQHISRSSTT